MNLVENGKPKVRSTHALREEMKKNFSRDRLLRGFKLSQREYYVLLMLAEAQEGLGTLISKHVGEELGIIATAVWRVMDDLKKADLVTMEPNPRDRRAKFCNLTPKGLEVFDRATDALLAFESQD